MMRPLINTVVFLCALSSCTIGPKYCPPEVLMPCDWQSPTEETMKTNQPCECISWWQALNDPLLCSLIEEATEQNLDVTIAAYKVMASREERIGLKTSSLYPHIDATANFGHAQFNNNLLKQALGSHCIHPNRERNIHFYEVGFDADWEIDLFGIRTHEINAAMAEEQASCESLRDLLVTLYAEIGRNYIELRGYQAQLQIIEHNIESQKESLLLAQGLFNTGFVGIIDPWQVEEQLNLLVAEKPLIELSIDKAIYRLSLLIGKPPGELYCELKEYKELPSVPCDKSLGLPSELLRNRPDIRRAERQLAAATEKVGSAMASFFPRLSLRGFIGDITGQWNKSGFAWYAGLELLAPIFNSSEIQQSIDLSKIRNKQAFYEYQKTVLNALEEAENAIASFYYEGKHNQQLFSAMIISKDAYEQTLQLYQRGFKNYTEVLIAQRSYLSNEQQFLSSKVQLSMHYIALYKALGGGWDCEQNEGDF